MPAVVGLIKLKKEEQLQSKEAEHCCPQAGEDVNQAVCVEESGGVPRGPFLPFTEKRSGSAGVQQGQHTCRETLTAPADSPKMVMFSGSPPKALIFLFTQAIAMCWSFSP